MPPIETRQIKALGREVSLLGFGTSQIGNTDHSMDSVNLIKPELSNNILSYVIGCGINLLDTGPHYGTAETQIGQILNQTAGNSVLVATKSRASNLGNRSFSLPSLRQNLNISRSRLGFNTLVLFQVNKPSLSSLRSKKLYQFLYQLKKENLIDYSGIIVGDIEAGFHAIKYGGVDTIQVLYNLIYQETESLIEFAYKNNVGVIVRSPLNSGFLSGAYKMDTTFNPMDERSKFFSGEKFRLRLNSLKNIQKELGISDADLLNFSLGFVFSKKDVSSVIPAASKISQLTNYIEAARNYFSIKPAERAKIRQVVEKSILFSYSQIQN
jgi:aryl-alcohol dehydrogenase-like predicted oxidoreductase